MPRGKAWTPEQDEKLRQLVHERREPEVGKMAYWDQIAAALPGPTRTGTAAQCRAADPRWQEEGAPLRERTERECRGPAWDAQGRQQGGKDAQRAAAAAKKR